MLKVVCLSALAYASAAPIINDRDAASPQLPSAAPITDTGTSEARFRPMVRARAPTRARLRNVHAPSRLDRNLRAPLLRSVWKARFSFATAARWTASG